MKFYPNLLQAVVDALKSIFSENKYADLVIENILKTNKKWGSNDRRFIAETTYDIVRWWRLLWEVQDTPIILTYIELKKIIQTYFILIKEIDELFINNFPINKVKNNFERFKNNRAIFQSVPDWLDELCFKELGEQWEKEITALNSLAKVVLRVNTIKVSKLKLQQLLKEEGIDTYSLDWSPDALVLEKRQNVFKTSCFKQGFFEIQDAVSQLVAPFLEPQNTARIVDACAGGGGKSLHIASLINNRGKIISLDTEKWKLENLQKRARRNSISNIEIRVIDSSKVIKKLKDSADRLLLDVPCSGLGVLRRNPDAKWKLSIETINNLKMTQKKILDQYCAIVKPGGILVYSTCSILPSENQLQIQRFIDTNQLNYELIEEKTILPSETGFDGFYMAKIIRKN